MSFYLTVDIDKRIWLIYKMESLKTETMKTFDVGRVVLDCQFLRTTAKKEKKDYLFPFHIRVNNIRQFNFVNCYDGRAVNAK